MNLVGELVLARNQILQFTATQSDVAFLGATQRLNLVTSELQEGVMKTRMQPIKTIWGKLPRVVRDLAAACGKQVRLEQEGEDTELDKAIIEAIKDPLTHIVRNAVDHGIEAPEVRLARGKPAVGTLRLRAYHEGGQINIEISDDGAGVNPARVRQKAVERGLLSADKAARMSDYELLRLIFQPGFSTADRVTNVSGRGVGMDVVKTNIERIGGAIDLQSSVGQGTTLRIKIPLTLAIIPALMVSSGGQRFAIPQVNLIELVRLEGEQARRGVERIQGARFHRLRGQLLPLVVLHEQLGLSPVPAASDTVNIVVLKVDAQQFGVVVEAIDDTEEIVVKPLDPELKELSLFAGATIRGDGRVALILDAIALGQRAKAIADVSADRDSLAEAPTARSAAKQGFLVFGIGAGARMALALEQVARLEEFPVARIERAGRHDVVQYRGGIMPLVDLPRLFNGSQAARDPRQVVVIGREGAWVGLVVEHVEDIAHEAVAPAASLARDGVSGSASLQGRVTELLDVEGVLRLAGFSGARAERAA
jgi:two-component system chemotaxis sensor kinase CheA